MASDDDRTAAETLRERLILISEIVEEYITDDGLEVRLRALKDRSGDHVSGGPARLIGRRALLDDLLALTRGSRQEPAVLTGPGARARRRWPRPWPSTSGPGAAGCGGFRLSIRSPCRRA